MLAAKTIALTEKTIPELQSIIGASRNGLNGRLDLHSVGLHRNPEGILTNQTTSKQPKRDGKIGNLNYNVRESSVVSNTREKIVTLIHCLSKPSFLASSGKLQLLIYQ